MSEPEEVLLEAAHAAIVRWSPRFRPRPAADAPPGLVDLHRRLGLFLAAMCPGAPPIVPAEPPASPTWIGRVMKRLPEHLVERRAFPATDGSRLRLPPRLDHLAGDGGTLGAYLVIALEMSLRAVRGSSSARSLATSPLACVLFAIAEAVAVERELVEMAPGLESRLIGLRERMLAERSSEDSMTAPERRVEGLLREVLASPPDRPPRTVPWTRVPMESLSWAEARAREWAPAAGSYRGVPGVFLWGVIEPSRVNGDRIVIGDGPAAQDSLRPGRTQALPRRPAVRAEREGEDDAGPGMAMVPIEDRQESAEDPLGLQRPADRDDTADAEGLADSVSELPELRMVSDFGTPREVLVGADPPDDRAIRNRQRLAPGGAAYPEWDWRTGRYRIPGALVHTAPGALGPDSWCQDVLRLHAPLIRQTRRRFERLRSRPVRLSRQADGPEIDLLAYVEAWSDARSGRAAEDRLYIASRPLRRDLAVVLLVDTSGSTDAWVEGRRRIVDVEKEALLVVHEGLEALGDRYAILAFSGEGAAGVRITAVKDFDDHGRVPVRRAIAGLEPSGFTRLGAAVRHASALLLRQSARHRLLLVLSDGKPNDVDEYEGRYGIEDARMAVMEARQDGLVPVCLTVDREASAYLPRIFGANGFTLLSRVGNLPGTLASILQRLVIG